jgi:DNA-binding transcriptional regulator YiaG
MPEQPSTPRNPVKEVRQALGLSLLSMSIELGCSQETVERCERMGTLPSKPAVIAEFRSLAKQAGIEIES